MSSYYSSKSYKKPSDSASDHIEHHYNSSVPQLHISTSKQTEPWNLSQQPRIVQDMKEQAYSPATSVHTTKTTSSTLLPQRIIRHHSDLSVAHNSLSLGLQSSSSLLTPSYSPSTFNLPTQEGTWSSFNLRSAENRQPHYLSRQSNVKPSRYPHSGINNKGYFSVRTSQSALSNEADFSSQSLPLDFYSLIKNTNVKSIASIATIVSTIPLDQESRVSSTRSRKSRSKPIKCDHAGCNKTPKCDSTYKKHQLKHEKSFTCNVPKCKRASQGFTTSNDLDRHKKSVHQVDFNKGSYRKHIQRIHQDEDETDNPEKQPSLINQESADAHIDASLMLAGMDKFFPLSPTMGNSSPLDLSMKHDHMDFLKQVRRQYLAPRLSLAQQTQIPPLTQVSAEIAPRETLSQAALSDIDYGFSNAPQTKAEQQKIAQKKPTAVSSPSSTIDIGHILDVLQQGSSSAKRVNTSAENVQPGSDTQSNTDLVVLTRRDALEIIKFITQSTNIAQAAPYKARKSQTTGLKVCPRPECGYAFNRECDLRRHMKRHKKPYGCTYPRCHKRFSAKSDWKRHENSQHFQPEVFQCAFKLSPGAICGVYSPQKEKFEIYLKIYGVSSPEAVETLNTRSKIGKDLWDERFDYIVEHLEQDDKKSIREWICVEQNKTKKELGEERMQNDGEDEERGRNKDFVLVGGDYDCDNPLPPSSPRLEHIPRTLILIGESLSQLISPFFSNEGNRKRPAPNNTNDLDLRSQQKRRINTITNRYCCSCQSGPCNSLQPSYLECNHTLCWSCELVTEKFVMVDSMELYQLV
ncbi:hypothetical protein COCCADRAFT_42231 [Bipolaris zeicola 26-R-13]|uniref:C2H2-type domain-containing protein n=1 Tax=Cochliobolus carbonum (strain 26-R-13) TaxID=930089 RepID=W6XMS2_COCC2|nr:uncharacterized protein COCCADRAFT_42231 [Bipolaris zeicola 26-R-13]EUC26808.1 hypothetical protein COCCADRAFT_42231 [Bipolaris zeicola 26-R-13]